MLNDFRWVSLKRTEIILSFLRLYPSTAFQTLWLVMRVTLFVLWDSLPIVVDIMVVWISLPIPVPLVQIPEMSTLTLTISCLTTSDLPWSWTSRSRFLCSTVLCSIGNHVHHQTHPQLRAVFTLAQPLHSFLGLLVVGLHSSWVECWTPSDLGDSSLLSPVLSFYTVHEILGKYTRVVCHSLLHWITFCQDSPGWPVHFGWPYMVWLIASLSYAHHFAMTRQ